MTLFLDALEIAAGVLVPDLFARRLRPRTLLLVSIGFLLAVAAAAFAIAAWI